MAGTITPPISYNKTARGVPISGNSVVFTSIGETLFIDPAGTLAALTIDLTAHKTDNKKVTVCTTQILTAITWVATGGGTTFVGAPASLAAGSGVTYLFNAAANKFVRCG